MLIREKTKGLKSRLYVLFSKNQKERKKQNKPKANRRKERVKIRAEINGIYNKKTIEKIKEIKSWTFGKKTNLQQDSQR